jgi:hypothetical protein
MKFPPYITKNDINKTIEIANKIRKSEGISQYLFFKKLATVAMYGELILSKITYNEFLYFIQAHLNKKMNNSIETFWGYDKIQNNNNDTNNKNFWIPTHVIKFGTQTEVEIEIYKKIIHTNNMEHINQIKLQQIINA